MAPILTNELKAEHEFVLQQVQKASDLGAETKEALEILLGIKNALLAHLTKEDKELYPYLKKHAESNHYLNGLLDRMSEDMAEITTFVLDFFGRLEAGTIGDQIQQDFLKLSTKLRKRIRLEEVTLYEEYDRLHSL